MCNSVRTTLEDYADVVALDPCSLAGISDCLSKQRRTMILSAIATAESMADDLLRSRSSARLDGRSEEIQSPHSTIRIPSYARAVCRRTVKTLASISEVSQCDEMATLVITIPPLDDGEEIVGISAANDGCDGLRWNVRFCRWEVSRDVSRRRIHRLYRDIDGSISIAAYARAFNFIDYSATPENPDSNAVVYLTEFPVCVLVEKPSIPKIYYKARPCRCGSSLCQCAETCADGCLSLIYGENYTIHWTDGRCPADCRSAPSRYGIMVTFGGVWGLQTRQAIVHWANTLVAQEVCSTCSETMTTQWASDNAYPDGSVIKFGEYTARRILLQMTKRSVGGI